MSYSYTNLQLRSADSAAVRCAIDLCDFGSAKILARADVPWIGVYPFMTEGDYPYLKEVAQRFSAQMELPVFGFMVPQGEAFCYVLCERGQIIDEYHSQPGENGPAVRANTEILMKHCLKGTTKNKLDGVLHKPATPVAEDSADNSGAGSGDKTAIRLASLLGIPRAQMCTGYNHLKWAQAGR